MSSSRHRVYRDGGSWFYAPVEDPADWRGPFESQQKALDTLQRALASRPLWARLTGGRR